MFTYGVIYTIIGVNYPECNLEIHNLLEGFLFSLESLATIGYGTESNDIFFGDCYAPSLTLLCEICTKLLLDALIIGTIYTKVSKPVRRAGTFITSDFATIRRVNGKLYFMFQFSDMQKHQLLSATLRLYSIHQEESSGHISCPFKATPMMFLYPERDYVPMFLYVPQLVVHEIDASSPLMPPQSYMDTHSDSNTISRSVLSILY